MKGIKYIYPLVLLGLFAIFTLMGGTLFRYRKPTAIAVAPSPQYTYLSPYVELSHYDKHFREAADTLGYDWTLIAAIAYTESRFDSTVVSGVGACGVMQMMPKTLRGFGVPDSLHTDNRTNIMAAAKLLEALEKQYRQITDKEERTKFVLASYNAGFGHILDAMRLAHKHGKDKHTWSENVDSFLIYKSKPEFFNDTLCRNGEFRDWKQTLAFVDKVQKTWKRFERKQKSYRDSIDTVIAKDTLKLIMQL